MRVLLVHNRYRSMQPSGENSAVDDEAALLSEYGVDVERLEVHSDEIATWPAWRRAGLPARVVWSRRGEQLVRAAIRTSRPDIVHFHNTFPLLSPASLRAASACRVPVVLTLHNFRPMCAAGTFLRDGATCEICLGRLPAPAVRYRCYRGSLAASVSIAAMIGVHTKLRTWVEKVDMLVVPSDFARRKYASAGWPEAKLVVKYNTAQPVVASRHGPGAGFAAVTRLSGEKGIDVLIDAWRRAFPRGEETLTIVGGGDEEVALRARAKGVAGVEFAGVLPREQATAIVAKSRALVMPSRWYEVFPRTVVEAYSVGVPVVASRIGALAEVVEDGHTGLLVQPNSAGPLACGLARLAAAPELSMRLGANAISVYERRYSPASTTGTLLEIYRSTLEAHAAKGGRE